MGRPLCDTSNFTHSHLYVLAVNDIAHQSVPPPPAPLKKSTFPCTREADISNTMATFVSFCVEPNENQCDTNLIYQGNTKYLLASLIRVHYMIL